jgi:hypothetical protein
MKKIYLILVGFLLMSSMAFAQNALLWQENFTTQEDFDLWSKSNTGPNPWTWTMENNQSLQGHGDNGKAYVGNDTNNDAWLVSPAKTLQGGIPYTVRFWKKLTNASTTGGKLVVQISDNASDFSSAVTIFTSSTGTSISEHTGTFTPPATGAYYIGFHATSGTTSSLILVDDVRLEGPAQNDLVLNPGFPFLYTQVPVSQKAVVATVKNAGLNAQTNVVFSAAINGGAAITAPAISSLASGASSSVLKLTSGVTFNSGSNTVEYTVTQDETDDTPADNTATATFTGTSIVYATDNLTTFSSSTSIVSLSKTAGNIYTITDPVELSGIAVGFGYNATYALTSTIEVYRLSGALTVESAPIITQTLTREAAAGLYTASLSAPVALTPGDYFVAIAYTGNVGIARSDIAQTNYYEKTDNTLTLGGIDKVTLPIRLILKSDGPCDVTVTPAAPVPSYYSVTLSWESDAVYQYKVAINGKEYITGQKTLTVTGLASGTEYPWTVTPYCDPTTAGTTVNGTSFTTLQCAEFTAEGFNDALPPNGCWLSTSSAGDTPWLKETNGTNPSCTPHEGTGMLQFKSYSSPYSTGKTGLLVTPAFTHTGHLAFKFWMYRDNGYASTPDKVNIYASETQDMTGLTPIKTVNRSRSLAPVETADGWYQYEAIIPGQAGSQYYIGIEGVSGYGNNIYLDEVSLGDFVETVDAAVTAVTTPTSGINLGEETVTVTIKNNGNVALPEVPVGVKVNGVELFTETVPGPLAPDAILTYPLQTKVNLTATETTTFEIKAYTKVENDANLANDTIPISVTNTVCNSITTLPWVEDFNDAVAGTPYLPTPCWVASSSTSSYWDRVTASNGVDPATSPKSGAGMLRFNAYSISNNYKGVLVTPPMVLNYAAELAFWIYRDTGYPTYKDSVNIYATSSSDITGSTPLKSVYRYFGRASSNTAAETAGGWYQYKVTIPAQGWENTYIALEGVSNYGGSIFVDSIAVKSLYTTLPAANATNVVLTQPLQVNFTETGIVTALAANAADLITVKENGTENTIALYSQGTTYSAANKRITIDHRNQAFVGGKTYTVTIPAAAMVGYNYDIVWSFSTVPTLVATTTPEDGATNLAVDAEVKIDFNRAATRVTGATTNPTITDITDAANPVQVNPETVTTAWSNANATLTINHAAFDYGKTYKVALQPGNLINAADQTAPIEWSFTTATAATIVAIDPGDGDTNIDCYTTPSIQFSKSIQGSSLAGITINGQAITPTLTTGYPNNDGVGVPNTRLIFSHATEYDYNTTYAIHVPAAAIAGYAGEDIDWSFTTTVKLAYTATSPADGATDVALTAPVTVAFNKNVVTWVGFGWKSTQARPVITIVDEDNVAVGGVDFVNIAIFSPSDTLKITHNDFEYGKTYTVTVDLEVVPAYGQLYTEPITWSFSTVALASVVATDPEDGDTDIARDAVPYIQFSKSIEGSTLEGITINGEAITPEFEANAEYGSYSRLVFTHAELYDPETVYTIKVPATALTGYAGGDIEFAFTTVKGDGLNSVSNAGKVYASDHRLHVSGYPAGSTITVYNVIGEATATRKLVSTDTTIDLSAGVYVVNVQTGGKVYIHKVFVK